MALSERAEEILESLWIEIVELKKGHCDASILKDDETLRTLSALSSHGYIHQKDEKLTLTQKGREEGRNCVRRHRLAERLFVDVFDVRQKLVHETSCKFEHLLHKGLDDNICTLLGHPKTCPHGKVIPEGSCCRDAKRVPRTIMVPLSKLKAHKKARISYLQTKDKAMIQKIIAIGALPGADITLIQTFPSYVFQIGKSQFAIDKELASHIYVRIY